MEIKANAMRHFYIVWLCALIVSAGCAASTPHVIPTPRPTQAPTDTPAPTNTPAATDTPQAVSELADFASATPLFGPSATPAPGQPTATPIINPNAPRIEFFQAAGPVEPGDAITLLWSTRNVERAVIYQLTPDGDRDRAWNVAPAGRQAVRTSLSDRAQIEFVIVAGAVGQEVEQRLIVPIICTVPWFFDPPPQECADAPPEEAFLIEQRFERGRMVYVRAENRIYALFNDGQRPAWIRFEDRYNPEEHAEFDAAFQPPPGLFQPVARLGFLWRGNDTVRNRLGLAIETEVSFQGATQRSRLLDGTAALYITSPDGTILQILGTGGSWQIITPD